MFTLLELQRRKAFRWDVWHWPASHGSVNVYNATCVRDKKALNTVEWCLRNILLQCQTSFLSACLHEAVSDGFLSCCDDEQYGVVVETGTVILNFSNINRSLCAFGVQILNGLALVKTADVFKQAFCLHMNLVLCLLMDRNPSYGSVTAVCCFWYCSLQC